MDAERLSGEAVREAVWAAWELVTEARNVK